MILQTLADKSSKTKTGDALVLQVKSLWCDFVATVSLDRIKSRAIGTNSFDLYQDDW